MLWPSRSPAIVAHNQSRNSCAIRQPGRVDACETLTPSGSGAPDAVPGACCGDAASRRGAPLLALLRRNQHARLPAALRRQLTHWRPIVARVHRPVTGQVHLARHHARTFWGRCARLVPKLTARGRVALSIGAWAIRHPCRSRCWFSGATSTRPIRRNGVPGRRVGVSSGGRSVNYRDPAQPTPGTVFAPGDQPSEGRPGLLCYCYAAPTSA